MEFHCRYFFKGLVHCEKVVNFISVNAVLLHHIRDVLLKQQGILLIKLLDNRFLSFESIGDVSLDNIWVF